MKTEHKLTNGKSIWFERTEGVVSARTETSKSAASLTKALCAPAGDAGPTRNEVWLTDASGVEKHLNLGSLSVPMRAGQRISVLTGGAAGSTESAGCLGVMNHGTGDVACDLIKNTDLDYWPRLSMDQTLFKWIWISSCVIVGGIVATIAFSSATLLWLSFGALFGLLTKEPARVYVISTQVRATAKQIEALARIDLKQALVAA